MPRKRRIEPDQIEQDFLDALERLKDGRPQNPQLRKKVRDGKSVKINISNVSKEACRSRSLIGMADCRYPKVRQLILIEAGISGMEPGNRDDVIANLRVNVAELRAELAVVKDNAAYHFDLRTKAERRLAELQARFDRLRKQVMADTKHAEKVITLFPSDDSSNR